MLTRRSNISNATSNRSNGNRNTRRSKIKQQEKKQVKPKLKASTKSNGDIATEAVAIPPEQPPVSDTLNQNSLDNAFPCTNAKPQEFLVHQTEQEVAAQFEAECRVGRILTPDEICEIARVIYEELLHEELKQREGISAEDDTLLSAEFNACEEWFQDFCMRYDIPWRPHVEPPVAPPAEAGTSNEVVIINLTEDDDSDESVVEVPLDQDLKPPQRSVRERTNGDVKPAVNRNSTADNDTKANIKTIANQVTKAMKTPPAGKQKATARKSTAGIAHKLPQIKQEPLTTTPEPPPKRKQPSKTMPSSSRESPASKKPQVDKTTPANRKPPVTKATLANKAHPVTKQPPAPSNKTIKNPHQKPSKSNSTGPVTAECKQLARKFIRDFHRLIDACDYAPPQVFNAAQLLLKWKMLPQIKRLFARESLAGADECVSLLLCGNASGDFLVKPMLLHYSYEPLEQDEALLPIYMPPPSIHVDNNRAELFLAWLRDCFVPEVRDFLEVMNLPAKALLLVDHELLQGHAELPLTAEDNFVEFLYFPSDVVKLLQPLSLSVMPTFACNYLQRQLKALKSLSNSSGDDEYSLQQLWSEFSLSDALRLIQKSIEEINVACWHSGWVALWKELVKEPFDSQLIASAIKRMAATARQIQDIAYVLSEKDVEQYLRSNSSLKPAFRKFDAQKIKKEWRDSENDSDIEVLSSINLDKNPFLLKQDVAESEAENEEADNDEDDVKDIDEVKNIHEASESKIKRENPMPATELNGFSEEAALSPALPLSSCDVNDYDVPPDTPEFDMNDCHSQLSSPTVSERHVKDLDDEESSEASDVSMEVAVMKRAKNRPLNKVDGFGRQIKAGPSKSNGARPISSQRVNVERRFGRVIPFRPDKDVTPMFDKLFERVADFLNFDESIPKHRHLQKSVLRYFRSQITDDPTHDRTIQRIWRGVLSDQAAYNFVWRGRLDNKRIPVVNLKFTKLLKIYFLRKHKMSERDFETTCIRTFESFHERQRRRLRQMALAEEEMNIDN